jgi:hypothetical protein
MQTTERKRKYSTRDRNKYNVFGLNGICHTDTATNRTSAYNLCRKLAKDYVTQNGGTMVQHNTAYVVYKTSKANTDTVAEFYMLEVQ